MDSVDIGGSICRDAGDVVRRCEHGLAKHLSEPGELWERESRILGLTPDFRFFQWQDIGLPESFGEPVLPWWEAKDEALGEWSA